MQILGIYPIARTRSLARIKVGASPQAVAAPSGVEHVFPIDASYSMYDALRRFRDLFNNKLATCVGPNDSVTIIAFSGKGQCHTVVKGMRVGTLKDLSDLHNAVNRWLQPIGLTGFLEPLQLVADRLPAELAEMRRLRKEEPMPISMMFVTDGYDNQWPESDILEAASRLQQSVSSVAFVEFGYYCNRPLMVKMAERAGGSLVFAEDFQSYEPVFDRIVAAGASGAKRIKVSLDDLAQDHGSPIGDFVFSLTDSEIRTYSVADDGTVTVPEDVGEIWAVVKTRDQGEDVAIPMLDGIQGAAYAAMVAYSQRAATEVVLDLLKTSGDVRLIRTFGNCFTKQQFTVFEEMAMGASLDEDQRLLDGFDRNAVPKDDIYTVFDLLDDLYSEEANRIRTDSPDWKYSRIGRKAVDRRELLTAEEQEEVDSLMEKALKSKKAKDLSAATARMEELIAAKPKPAEFVGDYGNGIPFLDVTMAEKRPNVSILTMTRGVVKLPENKVGLTEVPSHIWRNYAIVSAGVVNLKKLPVSVGEATFKRLQQSGMIPLGAAWSADATYTLDLTDTAKIQVINRKMVKSLTARQAFSDAFRLLTEKAACKVYDHYAAQLDPKSKADALVGALPTYTKEQAEFLAEVGITRDGFNPKRAMEEPSDVYTGYEMDYKVKGLSSLPSINDVFEKRKKIEADVAAGKAKPAKLTLGESVLAKFIDEIEDHRASSVAVKKDGLTALSKWVAGQAEYHNNLRKALIRQTAMAKFCVLAGQAWFSDFDSRDQDTLEIDTEFGAIPVTAAVREVQIKV